MLHRTNIRSCPDLRAGPKGGGEETVDLEFRLEAALRASLVPNASDAGACLLDEVDAVEQVGDQRVPPNALAAKISERQASRQTARAYNFDAVGVDLDKDVGPVNKPIAVHDGVCDRLSQGVGRILRDILTLESLYAVSGASIALHETQGVLDVRHNPAVEILTI